MFAYGQEHQSDQWRLFIDASKVSLKVVLLHNSNKLPSVPLVYCINMKEIFENMSLLLEKMQYNKFKWNICADLKVIALLLSLQLGYAKFCYFLCEWGSRDEKSHYIRKLWPKVEEFNVGQKNVSHEPLVSQKNVYLPPLYIKLINGL